MNEFYKVIAGRTFAEILLMQGGVMETIHRESSHRARINGKDVVGPHGTEIGLCMALEELNVHPAVLIHDRQYREGEELVNVWKL